MNRNRFWLIVEREYRAVVARKSFLLITLLSPVIMLAIIAVPVILSQLNSSDISTVSVVDLSGKYGTMLEDDDTYRFDLLKDATFGDVKERYDAASGNVYAILVIPTDVERTCQVNIYSDTPVKNSLVKTVERSLNRALTDSRIASYNISGLDKIIRDSQVSVSVKSHTWGDDGDSLTSGSVSAAIGMTLAMLTYFFVLMYGSMIMSSVVQDKTNRIAEVIVSACKPVELMLGKIVSIALVGLTQIAVWVIAIGIGLLVLGAFGITVDGAASMPDPEYSIGTDELSEILQALAGVEWARIIALFIAYFIGGYLLYASVFAAFGSAVDQQSDTSQFMTPVMMIIVTALMIGQACVENPDGTLAVVSSYIPLTSPIVMMIRLPYNVAWWEIGTSLMLLYVTALALTWIAARIYRTGLMMYGRKISYRELLKWIK